MLRRPVGQTVVAAIDEAAFAFGGQRGLTVDLTPYLEAVRADLEAVAGSDEATEAVAERLVRALEPSLQLRMLDALGQAAQELNEQMPSGRIDVRLAGRDVHLVFAGDEPPADVPSEDADDDGRTARITLRVPETIKTRIERQANREGLSTNAWLARAVGRGLDQQQQRRRVGSRIQGMAQS